MVYGAHVMEGVPIIEEISEEIFEFCTAFDQPTRKPGRVPEMLPPRPEGERPRTRSSRDGPHKALAEEHENTSSRC